MRERQRHAATPVAPPAAAPPRAADPLDLHRRTRNVVVVAAEQHVVHVTPCRLVRAVEPERRGGPQTQRRLQPSEQLHVRARVDVEVTRAHDARGRVARAQRAQQQPLQLVDLGGAHAARLVPDVVLHVRGGDDPPRRSPRRVLLLLVCGR